MLWRVSTLGVEKKERRLQRMMLSFRFFNCIFLGYGGRALTRPLLRASRAHKFPLIVSVPTSPSFPLRGSPPSVPASVLSGSLLTASFIRARQGRRSFYPLPRRECLLLSLFRGISGGRSGG